MIVDSLTDRGVTTTVRRGAGIAGHAWVFAGTARVAERTLPAVVKPCRTVTEGHKKHAKQKVHIGSDTSPDGALVVA